jgi:beta-phosphoglucomutase-like phosphatase (HAD superfamily)
MSDTDKSATEFVPAAWAVLLDIDFAAVNGALCYREAAAEALKGHGIDLSDGMFARFMLTDGVEGGTKALFSFLKRSESPADTVEAIRAAFAEKLAAAEPAAAVKALIKAAESKGGTVVCVSSFGEEHTGKILAALKLPDDTAVIEARQSDWGVYPSDVWIRAMRMASLPARNCVAVVTHAKSGRSAMMAGLNIAVLATPLTEHMDFTGADFVGDASSSKGTDTIVGLVQPAD